MTLREDLMAQKVDDSREKGLSQMLRIANLRAKSHRKKDLVDALEAYLKREETIHAIWKEIPDHEKSLILQFLRSGTIDSDDVERIFLAHNQALPRDHFRWSYLHIKDVFSQKSKAHLLVFYKGVPRAIAKVLKQYLTEPKIHFQGTDFLREDEEERVFTAEKTVLIDIPQLLRLINQKKLKVSKAKQVPTKASMQTMDQALTVKEPDSHAFFGMGFRTIEHTTRLYGLYQIMYAAQLVQVADQTILLGPRAEEYLRQTELERGSMLLEAYKRAINIKELDRIPEKKLQWKRDNFSECRQIICEYLTHCPINKWVDIKEFHYMIKKYHRRFLKKALEEIHVYRSYRHYYYPDTSWDEIPQRFIDIVLLEYLAMIGIVDVCLVPEHSDQEGIAYFSVDRFRLTPLGAAVLGIYDGYEEEDGHTPSGLIIQPDFEIIVPNHFMKDSHCLFLDDCADLLSAGKTSVYKITFSSLVQALDRGISVREVLEYLQKHTENAIPENVQTTLESWEEESKKIRIRNITILETDDPYLLEELKSYKRINSFVKGSLELAVELEEKAAHQVKREIEKKHRFCQRYTDSQHGA